MGREDDYEIEPSVYSKLKNATGWDSNGDITIDNVKYRRLSSDDTTYKFLSDQEGYYNWDKDNDTKYHYFRYEKIKWRVLNVDGNEALLLSDKILDTQKYDTWHKTTWEKSIIRSWLNGYKGLQNSKDDDYTKNNFINSAFSEEEENAIEETKLKIIIILHIKQKVEMIPKTKSFYYHSQKFQLMQQSMDF